MTVLSGISSLPEMVTRGSKMCDINCLSAAGFVFLWSSVCTIAVSLANVPAAGEADGNISMPLNAPDLRPSPRLLTSSVLPAQLRECRKPSANGAAGPRR